MLAERLSRLEGREKFGLLLVMLALIVLVLDWLVVRPINVRCAWMDADLAREAKTLAYQAGVLQAGPTVAQQYAAIGERLGSVLPAAEARNVMKGEIAQLAQDSDVTLVATKDREAPASEFYDAYAMDISDFETDEQGMMRFLHALSTGAGAYRVTRLKLAPDSTGKRLKGTMTVTKVTIPAPKEPAPAPSAPPAPAAPQG